MVKNKALNEVILFLITKKFKKSSLLFKILKIFNYSYLINKLIRLKKWLLFMASKLIE